MHIACRIDRVLSPDAMMIRKAVFIEEQGFQNEFDQTDETAFHLVLYADGAPAAVARLFAQQDGAAYTVGRIAVLSQYRGLHLGNHILKEAEQCARRLGAKRLVLSAQCRVQPFYEKNGYTASGDVYLDEFCPHIHMEKML